MPTIHGSLLLPYRHQPHLAASLAMDGFTGNSRGFGLLCFKSSLVTCDLPFRVVRECLASSAFPHPLKMPTQASASPFLCFQIFFFFLFTGFPFSGIYSIAIEVERHIFTSLSYLSFFKSKAQCCFQLENFFAQAIYKAFISQHMPRPLLFPIYSS